MHIVKAFKSSHTLRITIPSAIRHALNITAGQQLLLEHTGKGIVTLRNAEDVIAKGLNRRRTK